MPDRAIELRVNATGYPVHIVTVPAGPSGAKADITLHPGGVLQIRVLDEAGAPVPGANLHFMPDGEHPYDGDLDKSRRTRSAGPDGRLEVHLQARGHRVRATDAEGKRHGEASSVVVRAGETTTLEIRVR